MNWKMLFNPDGNLMENDPIMAIVSREETYMQDIEINEDLSFIINLKVDMGFYDHI